LRPLEGVRELRERRMLSQQELADRAGVSLFTVQRIERGEGSVRPKTGRAIAAALGVSVEDLLGKAQAPLPDFEVQERREDINEVALAAARRQLTQDRQAAARALESERAQAYFMHHENAAVIRLLQYPQDELAGSLMELARGYVELEERRPLSLEDFPAEQVAAFLAENERDKERLRRELEKMSAAEFREALLTVSPRLRRYFRKDSTTRETSEEKQGRSA
jgi:transcriptional regulator with XRE-family HTH domain